MTKKIGLLLIFIGFLQSCAIHSEFVFHKDNTISSTFEVEMDGEAGTTEESKTKFPAEWTSIYDLNVAEGKQPTDVDSIELAKRAFVRGIFKDGKETGFGFRFERMTQQEWDKLGESQKAEEKMLSSFKESTIDWDGKKLIINLEELTKPEDNSDEKPEDKKDKKDKNEEFGEKMLEEIDIRLNVVFRFENKVKSVQGKHPNFKRIDEQSFQFKVDLKEEMNQSDKKKKHDKQIVIITE